MDSCCIWRSYEHHLLSRSIYALVSWREFAASIMAAVVGSFLRTKDKLVAQGRELGEKGKLLKGYVLVQFCEAVNASATCGATCI